MPLVLDKCDDVTLPEMEERGAVFRCQGYGGIAVRVAEGDLRMFVSYRDRAGGSDRRQADPSRFQRDPGDPGMAPRGWETICNDPPVPSGLGRPQQTVDLGHHKIGKADVCHGVKPDRMVAVND